MPVAKARLVEFSFGVLQVAAGSAPGRTTSSASGIQTGLVALR